MRRSEGSKPQGRPASPGQPHALRSAEISHTAPVPPDAAAEPDYLALPDAPAVVIVESADGGTVLIATTASARELARRRLAPAIQETRSLRPDLRSLCCGGRIHAIKVGSSLEADAVYLHQARERTPHLAKVASERWRAWFAHVDPDAEFPQWTKTNLVVGLVGKRSASSAIGGGKLPPGVFLGPLPDKDAAGRFIEAMIDCFELCRFHNLLVQAPKAAPCAYKEMGRCPAPCDGTEAMEGYRRRTREAVEYVAAGRHMGADTDGPAALASDGDDRTLPDSKLAARLATLRKPAFAHIGTLNDQSLLLLLPSPVPSHVRFVLAHRARLLLVADADPADQPAIAEAAAAAHAVRLSALPLAVDAESIDTIAITARWLFLPAKKRRGEMVGLEAQGPGQAWAFDAKVLQRAAKSVLVRGKAGESAVETHEIEP